MNDIKNDALIFNMYYGGKSVAEAVADGDKPNTSDIQKVDETTPIFRNIDIRNVVCNGAGRAMLFNGLPEMPIDGITLENIDIIAKKGDEFNNSKNIKKNNVNIKIVK